MTARSGGMPIFHKSGARDLKKRPIPRTHNARRMSLIFENNPGRRYVCRRLTGIVTPRRAFPRTTRAANYSLACRPFGSETFFLLLKIL